MCEVQDTPAHSAGLTRELLTAERLVEKSAGQLYSALPGAHQIPR